MKRTVISAAVLALGLVGAGVSLANPPASGGPNTFGQCTAYVANQGHGNSHNTKPAEALQYAADQAGNQDGSASADEITSYCANYGPGGK